MKENNYLEDLLSRQIQFLQKYYVLLNKWLEKFDVLKIDFEPFTKEEDRLKKKIQKYEKILITFDYYSNDYLKTFINQRKEIILNIENRSMELRNKLDIKQNEIQNELDKLKTKSRSSFKSKWVEPRFIDFNV